MAVIVEKNCNLGNVPIPGIKESKATVFAVMRSEEHSDDLVTCFFSPNDAIEYCKGKAGYYVIDSNVF